MTMTTTIVAAARVPSATVAFLARIVYLLPAHRDGWDLATGGGQ
jgi:hypothetical protein